LAARSTALVEVGEGEWCQLSAVVTPAPVPTADPLT
jgi:hypothetical protein